MGKKRIVFDRSLLQDSKGRQFYFDNAKFILITLVVLGHTLEFLTGESNFFATAWSFIYMFHMAALIFISGYFAKSYLNENGEIKVQRPFSYLLLYFISQILFFLLERFIGKESKFTLFLPKAGLWFLLCLSLYYLILPLLSKLNPKYVMAGSIVFALIIGYDTYISLPMTLSRFFVHLPFFMMGYYIKWKHIQKLFSKKARLFGMFFILFLLTILLINPELIPESILLGREPYRNIEMALPHSLAFVYRIGYYLFSAGLVLSVLAFIPRCWTFFSKLGGRTLSVYILHLVLYILCRYYHWNKMLPSPALLFLVAAITMSFVFSLKLFYAPFGAIMSIKVTPFLQKNKDQQK